MTGDEAYQRRLAMSAGLKRSSPPAEPILPGTAVPAFAPSTSVPDTTPYMISTSTAEDDESEIPGLDVLPPLPSAPVPRATTETGEEAYLRRLAMSQRTTSALVRPPSPEPPALAYNPFAPTVFVPSPSAAGLPSTGMALSEEKVKSSREAAAAIAAKLAALAPPESSADASPGSTEPTVPVAATR